MSQSNSNATLDVVSKEIEGTMQAAEKSLSSFLEDRDSGEDLQNCIDYLNQLRGIYMVVEMKGAIALAEETIAIATDVPVGATEDKNDLLSSLSDAVFELKRYSEYIATERKDFPELLFDTLNTLRIRRRQPVLLESSFQKFDPTRTMDLMSSVSLDRFSPLSDFEHHIKRFRQIFQAGMVTLLRDNNRIVAFKLLSRASEGLARLCVGYAMCPFWALVGDLIKSLDQGEFEITDTRKRLLMRLERACRALSSAGTEGADADPDAELTREVAFLLLLADPENESAKAVLASIALVPSYSEEERIEQTNKLEGPGAQVIDSLAKAVNEDLAAIKEKLDLFERGSSVADDEIAEVSSVMNRLSSVLIILNLPKLSADCADKAALVNGWQGSDGKVSEEELLLVADAIIGVEAAIAKYKESGVQSDHVVVEKDPDNHFLKEARMMVLEESQGSLALTKRSISAYIESGGDKLHLANITQALDCSRGGMFLMGRDRLASIIESCERCIKSELIDAPSMPDEKLLETLADALSSIEYYIEVMDSKAVSNDELLKLSEESLKSIGYEVAA